MPLIALALAATGARASELLTNGSFETGDLSGWTVTDQAGGSGSWFIAGNGTGSPLNGFPTPTLTGGGSFTAQTDQGGPGSHTLAQSFIGIAGETYILNFDAFAVDLSGVGPVGVGLNFNPPANQHVEVNILGLGSSQIYTGIFTPGWAHYTFNISSAITTSGVYTVAFSEVDNQLFLNAGIDNVSLTSGAVPEPATWALMLGGFGLAGVALRRRRVAALAQ